MAIENDVVLIYFEDAPLAYARVEEITADSKPDWYHVKLLLLQVPLQVVTWILRDIYIDGAEFTMNGKRMRIDSVVAPEDSASSESREQPRPEELEAGGANVISLGSRKKS